MTKNKTVAISNEMELIKEKGIIENYVNYFNNERLAYSLKYKTPIQYRTELGFR